ncbi:hypothetical protein [Mesorhizobium sp.]|uniref:hypothetical protein n=1 Tax=Mesorhizobium sp. TaxID=1871066 RepID=UPI000FE32E65|nr:hypothetical protein [Mesorhizobium sp.]RWB91932.1 MAG: hypothetical protein EOQ56_37360 [Mesorhizobium sp.]RWO97577.1 MAG: hypothetical protein EOQ99_31980 [Mesorhizobium sp.]RWP13974.1 MAG: hypothetical protein EOR01_31575 [Mesorhizobium sp.]RWP20114.1 MAG: hypothetical protein EOR02_34615 [Mesorhizobium sp.]RWQ18523.1 MAG: hypothetical protein EOR92_15490 [Mesorhizobium sp.]
MTSTKRVSHSIEKLTPNGRERLGSLNGEQPDTVEEEKDASRSEQLGDRFAYIARSARTGSDGPARHIAVALPPRRVFLSLLLRDALIVLTSLKRIVPVLRRQSVTLHIPAHGVSPLDLAASPLDRSPQANADARPFAIAV